jgi:hypothetical protein
MDLALWILAALLALYAGWLTLPRPVELDWERFFKLAMVTVVRGPLEAEGASADAWMEAGRALVWYHPAGRQLDRKVADPKGYEPPFPALPGERALLERLAAEAPEERLKATFSSGADEVLYDDPGVLGQAWQLTNILGPEADWDGVASWNDAVLAGLKRRHTHTRWVLLGVDTLAAPLREALGEDAVILPTGEIAEELEAALGELADRAVFVAAGAHADGLAQMLHARPGLRDKALAVIALGGEFNAAWMAENFDHETMDTELSRATPYFHVFFGDHLESVEGSRWPSPEVPATGRVSVEPVDLGLLPGSVDQADAKVLARALLLTVTARVALAG